MINFNFNNKMRNLATAVLSSSLLLGGCTPEKKTAKPNIIMFLVDDMGWQDTSVPFWTKKTKFNNIYETPAMERLADQGMKFTQAYACAVCTPTRVSLLSGMNAVSHRVTNWTYKRNKAPDARDNKLTFPVWNVNGAQPTDSIENSVHITSLPEVLRKNGYLTIHCGKAHFAVATTPGSNPLNLGFDINIAGHSAGSPGSYSGLKNYGNTYNGKKARRNAVPGLKKYHGKDIHLSEALTLEAKLAMDLAIERNKPFYLNMAHYAVHTPIQADSRFYKKYKDKGLPEIEARYASLIEGMDKSLGDLMDYLDEKGIADNTIILFMSDNGGLSAHTRQGDPLNTHNKPLNSGKGSSYEGGVREPMIVKWPGVVKPKSQCDDYLIIEDFYPTILEMAGVKDYKTVQGIDGKSFTPMLKQAGTTSVNRNLYWHYPNKWGAGGPGIGTYSAIRSGDWKLIYFYKNNKFELYNIKEDIGELNNLAESKPELVKKYATELSNYLRLKKADRPSLKASGEVCKWPDEIL